MLLVSLWNWLGIFAWPLVVCAIFVLWITLRIMMGFWRIRKRLKKIGDLLRPLSNEKLLEIMRTPTNPDSQFALVELMRRGVDARPPKDQLFGMLISGNSVLCGQAMTNMELFYPELPIPIGASNLDPPELWQSRIAAFHKAG